MGSAFEGFGLGEGKMGFAGGGALRDEWAGEMGFVDCDAGLDRQNW